MMRLYYDPATGTPLHTYDGDDDLAPAGDWIDIGALGGPLASYQVDAGSLVDSDLAPARSAAIARVNAAAAEVRARYVTQIPGQEMIYLEKEAEAARYLAADPTPSDLTEFPFLAAETGFTAPTAAEVAQTYLDRAAHYRQIGAQLEGTRMEAISIIEAATLRAEIESAAAIAITLIEAM
ncbi:hypothetical protein [Rhodosalinus sediminis]|uniref:hypothetical protein n=1 Tax=Rhodosalinus sediminis TaxID=1940533 RepID=UPI002352BF25|nr:hypothetical protein [Rhodosalinus sediminis]